MLRIGATRLRFAAWVVKAASMEVVVIATMRAEGYSFSYPAVYLEMCRGEAFIQPQIRMRFGWDSAVAVVAGSWMYTEPLRRVKCSRPVTVWECDIRNENQAFACQIKGVILMSS